MLRLDDDQYEALVAHARAEYPNEACALLAGRDGSVERVYALPNAEASPTFYVVEPKAQLRAMTEMDDLGLDLVGIFHSHVATEAFTGHRIVKAFGAEAREASKFGKVSQTLFRTNLKVTRVLALIPGYEEGPRIGAVVEHARRHLEVLVVDDGSADDTAANAEAAGLERGCVMKYGMSIVVRGDEASRDTFDRIADKAEAFGLDTLWASDHLIMPALRVSRYPGRADGQLPDGWKRAYYQPFSVLNYLAARTRRVRLGTSVLILPMRNPIEVAAQVVGRVEQRIAVRGRQHAVAELQVLDVGEEGARAVRVDRLRERSRALEPVRDARAGA